MNNKILVIDDEKDLTDLVQTRLESSGYDVVTLNEPQRAIDVIKQERPQLILLHVMMPHKDGYMIKDEIRTDDDIKQIPIIIFTAKQSETEIEKDSGLSQQVDDYILKPFHPEQLIEKIDAVLKKQG